jgi:uncharacterized membrane protein YcaP (DUF421 family)
MSEILGLHLEPKDLSVLQVCLRGVIVFFASLIMVRLANKRFLAKMAAFDVILGFMLASMLARAINSSAPLVPTLACGFALVLLHRLLAVLAFHSHAVGFLVKGEAQVLVQNGQPSADALRAHKISEKDLLEELRLQGRISAVRDVELATMERNGTISVVPAKGN